MAIVANLLKQCSKTKYLLCLFMTNRAMLKGM